MKLMFEFDIEKKKIVFFGNGFEISSPAETYEDIAEFAKTVIENDICIPRLKHREEEKEKIKLNVMPVLLDLATHASCKNYYIKKTGELYDGQVVLNCGKITDNNGNELIFI